jgi:hypothetical protein
LFQKGQTVALKSTYTPADKVGPGGDSRIRPLGDSGTFDSQDDSWGQFAQSFRDPTKALLPPWDEVFGPLRSGAVDDLVVIGHIGCVHWPMPSSSASARLLPTIRN